MAKKAYVICLWVHQTEVYMVPDLNRTQFTITKKTITTTAKLHPNNTRLFIIHWWAWLTLFAGVRGYTINEQPTGMEVKWKNEQGEPLANRKWWLSSARRCCSAQCRSTHSLVNMVLCLGNIQWRSTHSLVNMALCLLSGDPLIH